MRIENLSDHLHHLDLLATWHQAQFGYLNPAVTLAQRMEKLAASAHNDSLPMTVVATSEGRLLGSASLLPRTITHQHLSPWLSSVYVADEHRNKGVGSALVQHIVQQAARLALEKVYLFTPNSEALYARLGWDVVEYAAFQGQHLAIMSIVPSSGALA
jgi:N-acetylglutamate synthase-like GNAT family acetyltransferase